jgi:hypothetical protein
VPTLTLLASCVRTRLRRREVALVEVSNRYPQVLDHICCEDLQKAFPQRVIVMKAWDNYIPLLAHNPHYHHIIKEMFGSSAAAFRSLNHYAIRPVTPISESVTQFRQANFEKKYVIGLQPSSGLLVLRSIPRPAADPTGRVLHRDGPGRRAGVGTEAVER